MGVLKQNDRCEEWTFRKLASIITQLVNETYLELNKMDLNNQQVWRSLWHNALTDTSVFVKIVTRTRDLVSYRLSDEMDIDSENSKSCNVM